MALEWKENFSVGVSEIDDQHKELVSRVNDFLEASSSGKSKEEIQHVFDFLNEYIQKHLHDEEELQLKIDYPGYELHKKQHNVFREKILSMKKQVDDEGATLPLIIRTNQIVVKWIIQHIGSADKAIGDFIRKNNIKV